MEREQRLLEAIDAIIPEVQNLSQSEWYRIVQVIDMRYTTKAAKVTLDGSDVAHIRKSLICELL